MKLETPRQIFEKILKYQISWKSVHGKPRCSKRTDVQADMTNLVVSFRHFEIASKKEDVRTVKKTS